jgi:hypothetical protein
MTLSSLFILSFFPYATLEFWDMCNGWAFGHKGIKIPLCFAAGLAGGSYLYNYESHFAVRNIQSDHWYSLHESCGLGVLSNVNYLRIRTTC